MQLSLTLRRLTLHGPHDLLGLPQYTMFGEAQTHTVGHESMARRARFQKAFHIVLARVNSRVVVRARAYAEGVLWRSSDSELFQRGTNSLSSSSGSSCRLSCSTTTRLTKFLECRDEEYCFSARAQAQRDCAVTSLWLRLSSSSPSQKSNHSL